MAAEDRLYKLKYYVAALIIGAACAASCVKHFVQPEIGSPTSRAVLLILLAICFSGPLYLLLAKLIIPRLKPFSRRAITLGAVGAVAAGALLLVAIPINIEPDPTYHHLTVKATGQKNPLSKGTEVWITGLYQADGTRVNVSEFKLEGDWEVRNGVPVSYKNQPAEMHWDGWLYDDAKLVLVAHPWSGIAQVWWDDGDPQTLNLYAENGAANGNQQVIKLPANPTSGSSFLPLAKQSLYYAADAGSIALLVFVAGVLLVTRSTPKNYPSTVGRWWILWYALPCAAVWVIYLIAFWPGLMSNDSINQWDQLTSGHLDNSIPAFHTITTWLITRVWLSPAAVALAQIIALSIVFGLTMRELEYWQVPKWVRVVITVAFSLSMANGLMVITLWKDIAFSIAMLGLFAVLLRVVRSRGESLRSPLHAVLLLLTLLGVSLYRFNGIVVSALTILALLWVWRKSLFSRILLLGGLWLGAFVLITGPLYGALSVRPVTPYFTLNPLVFQVGAMVKSDVPLSDEERTLLNSIQPIESWKSSYNCYSLNALFWNTEVDQQFFNSHVGEFLALWKRLVISYPGILAQHQLCVSSMIWRISEPTDGYLSTYYPNIISNNLGLSTQSLLPWLEDFITQQANQAAHPDTIWWVWRPALYLYISIFCVCVAAFRVKHRTMLIILFPVLVNSLVIAATSGVQDFRYQYPAYMTGLLLPALLFANPNIFGLPSADSALQIQTTEADPSFAEEYAEVAK
jgi:hypothetical protein